MAHLIYCEIDFLKLLRLIFENCGLLFILILFGLISNSLLYIINRRYFAFITSLEAKNVSVVVSHRTLSNIKNKTVSCLGCLLALCYFFVVFTFYPMHFTFLFVGRYGLFLARDKSNFFIFANEALRHQPWYSAALCSW